MNVDVRRSSLWVVVLFCALLALSCTTLDYRAVQREFNDAVQADNVHSAEAIGALTSSNSDPLYQDVRARLTDEHIAKLDERLRPNAYAIRAVSEWRTGKLSEARATALTGLQLSNVAASPRDEMVLAMIPALVIDEELVTRFKQAGSKLSKKEYDERYVRDLATASEMMRTVTARARPSTPDSIIAYVHLQQWRMLQNWWIVISQIQDGPDARNAARQDAAKRLDVPSLEGEIKRIEALLPPDDPLRRTMNAIKLR